MESATGESKAGSLQSELAVVENELSTALADLTAPFSLLVSDKLGQNRPMVRAALVLTSGLGAPDTAYLRARRIYLAAALEMLHLALSVHSQLLDWSNPGNGQGRSFLGSIILAGDFCFSRAASLAVGTDSHVVVRLFAEALKHLSEDQLRHVSTDSGAPFDVNEVLFACGVEAAAVLAELPEDALHEAQMVARNLAEALRTGKGVPRQLSDTFRQKLTSEQERRWEELFAWLAS